MVRTATEANGMKISVILGHPKKGSLNHALARTAVRALKRNGHRVFYHDLYAERFEPVLKAGEMAKKDRVDARILQYCRELSESEGLVIVHPNWWGQPPAVLKGWVDRVFRPGVAYAFEPQDPGAGCPRPLLKIRTAIIFNTSDTPAAREKRDFGDPLETLWKKCILRYCGARKIYRKMYGVVINSTPSVRSAWLEHARKTVSAKFPRHRI